MMRHGSCVLVLAAACLLTAAEEFPCRSGGRFVVENANIVQRQPMRLGSDLIGSFDVTVTLRNETGEDWSNVPLNVDLFEPDGTRLGAEVVPHTFRIGMSIRAGEEKVFTINRARRIPKPVTIGSFHVSLAPEAAQSVAVSPGTAAGFLAADIKCAGDFESARKAEGLEGRKRLAELVMYKCGFLFDAPIHAFVRSRQPPYAQVEILEGKAQGQTGWIPEGWLK